MTVMPACRWGIVTGVAYDLTMQPLFVDVYEGDLHGKPPWSKLADLGVPWIGGIIKATEGLWYAPAWFTVNWKLLKACAGERYGQTWFRGCYHFLKFNADGTAQADYFLSAVERAGGWDKGDIWPVVDVELGSEANSNQKASPQQIVDGTCAFADRIKEVTGRSTCLYGNGAMRDKRINSKMRCDYLWCPRYTPTLPPLIYERAGWQRHELVLWQYCGDGEASLEGYPSSVPGFGKVDISTLTPPAPNGGEIEWLKARL